MTKSLPSPIFTLKSENYIPSCMKFHLDGQKFYVGTQSGEILTWNLEVNYCRNIPTVQLQIYKYDNIIYFLVVM